MNQSFENEQPGTRSYLIAAVLSALRVMEAMEGDVDGFAPVTIQQLMARTGLSYDKVRRVLLTLQEIEWLKQTKRGWEITPRLRQFGQRMAKSI